MAVFDDPIGQMIEKHKKDGTFKEYNPEEERIMWEEINKEVEEYRRQFVLQQAKGMEEFSKLVINT